MPKSLAGKIAVVTRASRGIGRARAAMTAFGRVDEPTDIADVASFLASPGGRWITGACFKAAISTNKFSCLLIGRDKGCACRKLSTQSAQEIAGSSGCAALDILAWGAYLAQANDPPSMTNSQPVMARASSEAK